MAETENGRLRKRKQDKFEALKALRARGEKHKISIDDQVETLYEEVNETEYSKRLAVEGDGFIVDDDGLGYCDDGHDLFDEGESGDEEPSSKKKKKKKSKNENSSSSNGSGNIKSFFNTKPVEAMFNKSKMLQMKPTVEDDIAVDSLLDALHNTMQPKSSFAKKAADRSRRIIVSNRVVSERQNSFVNVRSKPINDFAFDDDIHPVDDHIADAVKPDSRTPSPFSVETEVKAPEPKKFIKGGSISSFGLQVIDQKTEIVDDDILLAAVDAIEEDRPVVVNSVITTPLVVSTSIHSLELPYCVTSEGTRVVRMYWLDLFEDHIKHPGTIYLFGKIWHESVKEYVSCCVVLDKIERVQYALPMPDVLMKDVHADISDLMAKCKISTFRCRTVTKKYAFEYSDVPRDETEYLEIRYPASSPLLPNNWSSAYTKRILGTNHTSAELLLLTRKLKGPSWIDISNVVPNATSISWCRTEGKCEGLQNVNVCSTEKLPLPPLRTLVLDIKASYSSQKQQSEICCVSGIFTDKFNLESNSVDMIKNGQRFCVIAQPSDTVRPFDLNQVLQQSQRNVNAKIHLQDNERALLNYLLILFQKMDPDVIISHDLHSYWVDLLLQRLASRRTAQWSKLGRLRRSAAAMPKAGYGKGHILEAFAGRLLCDVAVSARELIRCQGYSLTQLVLEQLRENRTEVPAETMAGWFRTSNDILELMNLSVTDAVYNARLVCDLNAIPLSLNITQLVGGIWGRTLSGGRSERNEFLLLHAFYDKGYICPEKYTKFHKNKKDKHVQFKHKEDTADADDDVVVTGRKKASYAGGLVLEPKRGFYDTFILLLDFNSLYPSIIQEFNICFTTLPISKSKSSSVDVDEILNVPDSSLAQGILPAEIRKLVESRREVKKLMKTPKLSSELYAQYNIRQLGLKLTANSMYGCLGFSHSRFHAQPLAALITAKGREILMHTKVAVEKSGLDVIYGDTDSIMINTRSQDFDQVIQIGKKVKSEINRSYRQLEIDIDGIFGRMLLLKKKKYAALKLDRQQDGKMKSTKEFKGLDIVRRDWSGIAKEAGNLVLEEILGGETGDLMVEKIHRHLTEVAESIRGGHIPIGQFEIHKQLTKAPLEYPDSKSLPHVSVALRLNQKGGRQLKSGDTIAYVICNDGTTNGATQRAYHIDELKKDENLTLDIEYYLSQQIHPVVSRLCEPIDGTDSSRIAESLGLDPNNYKKRQAFANTDEDNKEENVEDFLEFLRKPVADAAASIEPVVGTCPQCEVMIIIFDKDGIHTMSNCPTEQCKFVPSDDNSWLKNQLRLYVQSQISLYYRSWLNCTDPSCGFRTRAIPFRFDRTGSPICPECDSSVMKQDISELMIFQTLQVLQDAFGNAFGNRDGAIFGELKQEVDHWIELNGFSEVNLNTLFQDVVSLRSQI